MNSTLICLEISAGVDVFQEYPKKYLREYREQKKPGGIIWNFEMNSWKKRRNLKKIIQKFHPHYYLYSIIWEKNQKQLMRPRAINPNFENKALEFILEGPSKYEKKYTEELSLETLEFLKKLLKADTVYSMDKLHVFTSWTFSMNLKKSFLTDCCISFFSNSFGCRAKFL